MGRYLRERNSGFNVDIRNDPRYDIVRRVVATRQTSAAKNGAGPGVNSSDSVPMEVLQKMYEGGQFGRDNPRSLARTVGFTMSTQFGCRCKEEIRSIQNVDICYGPPSTEDPLVPSYIELSQRLTKTRRGRKHDGRPLPAKAFADNKNTETCPVRLLLHFQAKKTPHQNRPDGPFMLTISPKAEKNPREQTYWFLDGPMGKNLIGHLLAQGVKETGMNLGGLKITARSSRKTMAQAAAESVCSPEFTSKVMGHKSLDSKLNYMKVRDPAHKATSLAISRTIAGKDENMFAEIYDQTRDAGVIKKQTVECKDDDQEVSVSNKPPSTITSGALALDQSTPPQQFMVNPQLQYQPQMMFQPQFGPPPSYSLPYYPPPQQYTPPQYYPPPQQYTPPQYYPPPQQSFLAPYSPQQMGYHQIQGGSRGPALNDITNQQQNMGYPYPLIHGGMGGMRAPAPVELNQQNIFRNANKN